ncbi:MAG: hypothetical protein IPK63_23535 [Candidatus Competibacteraceae bacterium]|nr:hypothetical protein [Candidatus Competibacteraceae bacterium]
MRKIFQIDGIDGAMLSIGERNQPQQAAICIKDSQGNEVHMLIGYEQFRELCSLSYDLHWTPEPRTVQEKEEETPF